MNRFRQTVVLVLVASLPVSVVQGARVTDALIVGYDFREGSGTTVGDHSGVGLPIDLTIHDPSAVSWGDGFLSINSATVISSAPDPNVPSQGTAEKLFDILPLTEEITIEAWIQPSNNVANDGPARVVTMSVDPTNRNFTLGQDQTFWQGRYRTSVTGNNGTNPLLETPPPLALQLQHVVYTRAASGDANIYVDANLKGSVSVDGDLGNWDSNYDLALGNELTWTDINQRDWLGDMYLVAIYAKALRFGALAATFTAGPGLVVPLPTVTGDFDQNGVFDTRDADSLVAEIASGGTDLLFDVNSDTLVDTQDIDAWLSIAAVENGFASPYLRGDANLNGAVDAQDLNSLGVNWQQPVALWSAGDFSANGTVAAEDLNALGIHWQESIAAAGASAVPEPSTLSLLCIAMMGCLRRRRRVSQTPR